MPTNSRDFEIYGPTIVKVNNAAIGGVHELGLASAPIKIMPNFKHRDIHSDDFGPDIPADVMWMLADVNIEMTLVHYDRDILNQCITESMAGGTEGKFEGAGKIMGQRQQTPSDGHYIQLGLISLNKPAWRFPATYLADRPVELPIGTARTLATLRWRAIGYQYYSAGDLVSEGARLWDHTSM